MEPGLVKRTFRSNPLIPESEIQPEIVLVLFVMEGMMGSTDQQSAEAVFSEPSRVNFNTEVIDDTGYCHTREQKDQSIQVDRYKHNDRRNDNGLQYSFQRMKGKRGPWRGNMAFVMDPVHQFKYFRLMHEPVDPVIVGLVQEEKNGQA